MKGNRTVVKLSIVVAALAAASFSSAQVQVDLFVSGLSGGIGLDYQLQGNNLVLSTNYSGGNPYNFERISLGDASRSQFSSLGGLQSEIYPATIRDTWGAHAAGSVFTPGGSGGGGAVYKIEPDGSSYSLFTTLPSAPFAYTSAKWDQNGVWNHDLIVGSESEGKVWRIDSTGNYSEIFNVPGSRPEGLIVLGDNPRYGPWSGKVMALTNGGSTFYAIDQDGSYEVFDIGIGDLEAIQVFTYNPNGAALYVMNYPGNIFKLTNFENVAGFQEFDLIVASEFGDLRHVWWDGSSFQNQLLTNQVGQIESMVAVPEPGTFLAIGIGLAAVALRRRKK